MRRLISSNPTATRSPLHRFTSIIFLLPAAYCLLLIAFCLLSSEVMADEYHYNNILVGERAAGMGGAYTAVSDDPSGLYYNPAGIAFAPGRSFSASVNAYHYSRKEYKDVLGGNGWERVSSNLLPNYFGIIQPLGNGKIGFSYAVPDSRLENQAQTFNNIPGTDPDTKLPLTIKRYVINMNDSDYTYNFGPSYAIKLKDNLSIGTTIYIHYRDRVFISNQLLNVDDGRYQWTNTYVSLTEWGVRPILGLMWTPAEKVSLGLTLSKNYIFNTDKRLQTTSRDLNDGAAAPNYNVWESTSNRNAPLTTTLGIAWFPSESLLFSADISYYDDVSYTLKSKNTATGAASTEFISREKTFNMAIGTEYYPADNLALRGGVFTNMANTPKLTKGKADQSEHIDMAGVSASASLFSRTSSLTLGGSYSYGAGQAQVFSGNASIQDAAINDLTVFIAAAFNY